MDHNILKAIKKNAEKITSNVQEEIFSRPEAMYYLAASDEAVSNRISRVIRDVYERLENWLGRNEPKDLLFDYYLNLGATRCRQCMPLEEVAAVILMIKKEICRVISESSAADRKHACNEPEDIGYHVNLLFAGIIHSVIAGYRGEQVSITPGPGYEQLIPAKAFRI